MQPTVQSEQDKMVPIDTSGDPVEIEVKEDDKKVNESPEVEVQQDQPTETKKEELENLIKEYVKGGFEHELKREIIAIATDKKHLTYLECKHQFALGVLESSEYLNDNILGKFFDKDFA